MLWFSHRSYLKWAGAVAVVGLSWWIQLMPTSITLHPFAKADIEAGAAVSDHLFEFREVPEGLLPPIGVAGTLRVAMAGGDPLLPSLVSQDPIQVPDGWWALEMEAPPGLVPGRQVMLVAADGGLTASAPAIPGVVIRTGTGQDHPDDFALIAVPGEHLFDIASASAYGTLTVAVDPNR